MIYWVAGGLILLVYCAASYRWMYKDLERSPGPYGFGWLILPLAPVMPPLLLLGMIKRKIHNWTR